MGLASSGKPPKMNQKPAKNAAGAYQLPPDLRAAHAIAGSSKKIAAVSQLEVVPNKETRRLPPEARRISVPQGRRGAALGVLYGDRGLVEDGQAEPARGLRDED